MSKTSLKKLLKEMNSEQLTGLLLDMYDARKDAREYLEYFVNPDENSLTEKTKMTIQKEFFPPRGRAKARISVCRRALKEMSTLHPSPNYILDARLFLVECLVRYCIRMRWWIKESHENALYSIFRETLEYANANDLLDTAHSRITDIVTTLSSARSSISRSAIDVYDSFCADNGLIPVG